MALIVFNLHEKLVMKHLHASSNVDTGECSMGYLTKYHCMYVCFQTQPSAVGDTCQHLPIREDGYVMLQIILSKLETTFDIDQLGVSLSL